MTKLITRAEARAQGLTRYFTGKACPQGHICERTVSWKKCVKCNHINTYAYTKLNKIPRLSRPHRWQKKRFEAVKRLGNKCVCCNETRVEFLTLDHINSNGTVHRRSFKRQQNYLQWAATASLREVCAVLQVLCWNCNMAKAIYKICPHQGQQ